MIQTPRCGPDSTSRFSAWGADCGRVRLYHACLRAPRVEHDVSGAVGQDPSASCMLVNSTTGVDTTGCPDWRMRPLASVILSRGQDRAIDHRRDRTASRLTWHRRPAGCSPRAHQFLLRADRATSWSARFAGNTQVPWGIGIVVNQLDPAGRWNAISLDRSLHSSPQKLVPSPGAAT